MLNKVPKVTQLSERQNEKSNSRQSESESMDEMISAPCSLWHTFAAALIML